MNSVQPCHAIFLRSTLILSSNLSQILKVNSLPFRFSDQVFHTYMSSSPYILYSPPISSSIYKLLQCNVVPWVRRLVASLSLRRPGLAPGSVHVGFEVKKVHWDRCFSEFFGFPLSVSFHRGSPYSYIT
jgi:hypothetical protein